MWAWMGKHRRASVAAGLAALVVFFLSIVGLLSILGQWPPFDDGETAEAPSRRPAEFLYLDGERVLAYLAQYRGGNTISESQSQKLSKTLKGDLKLEGLLEAGASSTQEDSTQRVLAPTAASSFMALLELLTQNEQIRDIERPRYRRIENLEQGQLVMFRAASMRAPLYANPYLAVRQSSTLKALFPFPTHDPSGRSHVLAQREAARKFAGEVGDNPRVVFSLKPNDREFSRTRGRGGRIRKVEARPLYLMPVSFAHLTNERSLIKYGGGEFTVLGKVARIFPESGQERDFAYVDSPTRETWRRPLHQALGALLCRSVPMCLSKAPKRGERSEEARTQREEAIEETREALEDALLQQTRIRNRGAVIIPLAIYK